MLMVPDSSPKKKRFLLWLKCDRSIRKIFPFIHRSSVCHNICSVSWSIHFDSYPHWLTTLVSLFSSLPLHFFTIYSLLMVNGCACFNCSQWWSNKWKINKLTVIYLKFLDASWRSLHFSIVRFIVIMKIFSSLKRTKELLII